MPRASDGSYSLPPGTLVNSGDTILVSQHNPAMSDIAAALGSSLDRDGLGGMRANLPMGGNRITNTAPGINPTDVATVSQLGSSSSVPIGTVVDYAGLTPPSGWLLCGGQSVSRTDYAALFAIIGTAFGSDSSSTFRLPDCRGRVSAGMDFSVGGNAGRLSSASVTPDGSTLGANGGSQSITLTEAQMPAHSHSGTTASSGAHFHEVDLGGSVGSGGGSDEAVGFGFTSTSTGGAHTHTFSTSSIGGGQSHLNIQPTILFNKLIKAL